MERPLLAPGLSRLPRVLFLRAVSGAALDEAHRGLCPVGPRRKRRGARFLRRGGAAAVCERGGGPRAVPPRSLPGARRPRRARRVPAARARRRRRRTGRRDARRARGRGASPAGAPSHEGQRAPARVRGLGRAAEAEGEDVDAGAEPASPGALHLLADRARPRAAGRGDRRRAAQAPSRPGDRLARPAPGHGGAGGGG